jgi:hypothetical protein
VKYAYAPTPRPSVATPTAVAAIFFGLKRIVLVSLRE